MATNYRGESPGKKLSRFQFWVHRNIELLKQPGRRIVVLASENGGDVMCLNGLGVPPGNIIAVDRDEESLRKFSKKFHGVNAICGDVADVICGMRGKFDVVFLDFCSNINDETLTTCQRIARKIKNGGVLAIAGLKGREHRNGKGVFIGDSTNKINGKKIKTSIKRDELIKSGDYNISINYTKKISKREHIEMSEAMFSSIARLDPIWYTLCKTCRSVYSVPIYIGCYYSGSPMFISAFRILRTRSTRSNDAQNISVLEKVFKDTRKISDSVWRQSGTYGNKLILMDLNYVRTKNDLRDYILEHDDIHPRIHDMLCLPKMTVAAWKAHKTMGTYQ